MAIVVMMVANAAAQSLQQAFETEDPIDVAALIDSYQSLNPMAREVASEVALSAWTERRPREAWAYAIAHGRGTFVARAWAENDHAAASAAVEAYLEKRKAEIDENGEEAENRRLSRETAPALRMAVLEGLAKSNPQEAIAAAGNRATPRLARVAVTSWFAKDPEGLGQHLASTRVSRLYLDAFSGHDPDAAMAIARAKDRNRNVAPRPLFNDKAAMPDEDLLRFLDRELAREVVHPERLEGIDAEAKYVRADRSDVEAWIPLAWANFAPTDSPYLKENAAASTNPVHRADFFIQWAEWDVDAAARALLTQPPSAVEFLLDRHSEKRIARDPVYRKEIVDRARQWQSENPKAAEEAEALHCKIRSDRDSLATLRDELAKVEDESSEQAAIRGKIYDLVGGYVGAARLSDAGFPAEEIALFKEIADGAPLPDWARDPSEQRPYSIQFLEGDPF